jgi:hypothetical protein
LLAVPIRPIAEDKESFGWPIPTMSLVSTLGPVIVGHPRTATRQNGRRIKPKVGGGDEARHDVYLIVCNLLHSPQTLLVFMPLTPQLAYAVLCNP